MIVCVCHRVSDRDIAHAARNGCTSFDDLQFDLAVATACGKCHDCARETFHHHAELVLLEAARMPVPHRVVPIAPTIQREACQPTRA